MERGEDKRMDVSATEEENAASGSVDPEAVRMAEAALSFPSASAAQRSSVPGVSSAPSGSQASSSAAASRDSPSSAAAHAPPPAIVVQDSPPSTQQRLVASPLLLRGAPFRSLNDFPPRTGHFLGGLVDADYSPSLFTNVESTLMGRESPPIARQGLGFLAIEAPHFDVSPASSSSSTQLALPVSPQSEAKSEKNPKTALATRVARPLPPECTSLDLLECPVCLERMHPPIYQCVEGHTICNRCHSKVDACPACRSGALNIRCRALEQLTEKLTDIPCKFSSLGCLYTTRYADLPAHETLCPFRPLRCLHVDSGCHFESNPVEMAEHLLEKHGYEFLQTNAIFFVCTRENWRRCKRLEGSRSEPETLSDEEQQRTSLPPGSDSFVWQQQLYHCFDKYFVLRVHRRVDAEASFYISLIALSLKHHCCRYVLRVSGNHRTYSFQGPVWSATRGPQEIERVKDCLLLPENIALFLSGAKGSEQNLNSINLTITGEIIGG